MFPRSSRPLSRSSQRWARSIAASPSQSVTSEPIRMPANMPEADARPAEDLGSTYSLRHAEPRLASPSLAVQTCDRPAVLDLL